jgi:hypothetical protein
MQGKLDKLQGVGAYLEIEPFGCYASALLS